MKQLNKIKCGAMAFLVGMVTFSLLGIYFVIFSPFLAFTASKKAYKNESDIIEFDINYKNNEK
jgi:hypothetical protein